MSLSRYRARMTRGEVLWALDRAVVLLARAAGDSKRRAAGRASPGTMDTVELQRAVEILHALSIEVEQSRGVSWPSR